MAHCGGRHYYSAAFQGPPGVGADRDTSHFDPVQGFIICAHIKIREKHICRNQLSGPVQLQLCESDVRSRCGPNQARVSIIRKELLSMGYALSSPFYFLCYVLLMPTPATQYLRPLSRRPCVVLMTVSSLCLLAYYRSLASHIKLLARYEYCHTSQNSSQDSRPERTKCLA